MFLTIRWVYISSMTEQQSNNTPLSPRTKVRRGAKRATYDRDAMLQILRDGIVAHVGVETESGPLVLPMVYGIGDNVMYLHGALANSLLGASVEREICATVTIVDGLIFAKTPFNHSMNYQSVVVRGKARLVEDEEETLLALRLMTDHVVETWDMTRPLSQSEIRATRVVALPLDEMSGKVRTGGAVNVEGDEEAPYWSGQVPILSTFGRFISNDDSGADASQAIKNLEGENVFGRHDS